jgi:hypothetical protein
VRSSFRQQQKEPANMPDAPASVPRRPLRPAAIRRPSSSQATQPEHVVLWRLVQGDRVQQIRASPCWPLSARERRPLTERLPASVPALEATTGLTSCPRTASTLMCFVLPVQRRETRCPWPSGSTEVRPSLVTIACPGL